MEQDTKNQTSNNAAGNATSKPFPVSGQATSSANTPGASSPAGSKPQSDSGATAGASNPGSGASNSGSGSGSISEAAANAAPVVDNLLKRVTQTAHDAVDGVAAKISSTVEGLQGGVSKATDTRDEWVESAREAIRQHPFAAIGTAVLVGLALRSLTSSRDR